MATLRKAAFLLFALAALPAPAAELWYKDRVLFEDLPAREVEEGAALTFKVIPQGKYRYGWCAVTYPDGTTGDFQDAEIRNGKATQKLKLDKGKGKYVVEFLMEYDMGPAVGAIFHYWAGVPAEKDVAQDFKWDTRAADAIEKDVFDRINAFRKSCKVPEVAWDDRIAAIGRDHCEDMVENRFFAHISPTKGDLATRAKVRYGWKNVLWGMPDRLYIPKPDGPVFIGEDIAFDNNPAAAMDAWLGSPGHRAVFMNKFVTHCGVGVKKYEAIENGFLVRKIYFVAAFALYADTNIEKQEKEAELRRLEAKALPLFERAQQAEAVDPPAAVKLYEELAAKYPEAPSGVKAAARARELTGAADWGETVKKAEGRREARQWLDRAKMLLENKRPENARSWLEKVVGQHGGTPEAEEAARLLKSLDQ